MTESQLCESLRESSLALSGYNSYLQSSNAILGVVGRRCDPPITTMYLAIDRSTVTQHTTDSTKPYNTMSYFSCDGGYIRHTPIILIRGSVRGPHPPDPIASVCTRALRRPWDSPKPRQSHSKLTSPKLPPNVRQSHLWLPKTPLKLRRRLLRTFAEATTEHSPKPPPNIRYGSREG